MPRDPRDQGPTYRFRGHVSPADVTRTPIVAHVEQPATEDGIARLRLYDPIDSWGGDWGVSAKEFAAALDSLDDDVSEIHLHINSPGGEVFEGIAIVNALRTHRARVVAHVDGLAASAASFIAASADEVVMGRNTELMIHDAWGLAIGNAATMRDSADRLDHLSDNIASVYATKAGGTREVWRDAMVAETWYSADEAVAAGLADRVEGEAEQTDDAQNGFDLSLFTFPGRQAAPPPPVLSSATEPARTETTPPADPAPMTALQDVRHRLNERKLNLR